MANSTAIIIGVGCGPAIRENGLQPLPHVVPSVERIARNAGDLGYSSVTKLIGPDATHDNVDAALRAAARRPALDTVLVVFSGHGFEKNVGRFCEYGGAADQHWCLYDELMVDHHLLMRTQHFAPTTRLYIVADCCFAAAGSGVSGRLARMLTDSASGPLPDLFAGRPAPWESAVDRGREAVRKIPEFNCTPPQAQWFLLAASDTNLAEAGIFMRAFLHAWDEPGARYSFRTFRKRVASLGGRPVVRPRNTPLLDAPAFVP